MFKEVYESDVFLLSEKSANFIWKIVLNWNYFERDTVGKQLVRSVDSISANIAESHGDIIIRKRKILAISPADLWKKRKAGFENAESEN